MPLLHTDWDDDRLDLPQTAPKLADFTTYRRRQS